MTRDEANRKLAEWTGGKFIAAEESQWHHPDCSCAAIRPEDPCTCHDGCYWFDGDNPPDFYTSEETSALLLEKMPEPFILEHRSGSWEVLHLVAEDWTMLARSCYRKTAVAAAALKLLERE